MAENEAEGMSNSFKQYVGGWTRSLMGDRVPPIKLRNPILPNVVLPFDPAEIEARFRSGKTLDYVMQSQIDYPADVIEGGQGHRVLTGFDKSTGNPIYETYFYLDELTPHGRELVYIQMEHAWVNSETPEPEPIDEKTEISEVLRTCCGMDVVLGDTLKQVEPPSESEKIFPLRLKNPLEPETFLENTQDLTMSRFSRGETIDFLFPEQIESPDDLIPNHVEFTLKDGEYAGRNIIFMDQVTPAFAESVYAKAFSFQEDFESFRKKMKFEDLSLDELVAEIGRRQGLIFMGQRVEPSNPFFQMKIKGLGERIMEIPLRVKEGMDWIRDVCTQAGHHAYEAKKKIAPKVFMAGVLISAVSATAGVTHMVMTRDPSTLVSGMSGHLSGTVGETLVEHLKANLSHTFHEAKNFFDVTGSWFSKKLGLGLPGAEEAHRYTTVTDIDSEVHRHDLPVPGSPLHHVSQTHHVAPHHVWPEVASHHPPHGSSHAPEDGKLLGRVEHSELVTAEHTGNSIGHALSEGQKGYASVIGKSVDSMRAIQAKNMTDYSTAMDQMEKSYQHARDLLEERYRMTDDRIGMAYEHGSDRLDAMTDHALSHAETASSHGVSVPTGDIMESNNGTHASIFNAYERAKEANLSDFAKAGERLAAEYRSEQSRLLSEVSGIDPLDHASMNHHDNAVMVDDEDSSPGFR